MKGKSILNLQKLAKELKKNYWKWNQVIIVDTFEDRTWRPEDYCFADVCLYNPITKELDKWLFTIGTYNSFMDLDRTNGGDLIRVFDTIGVASRPYYINGEFFLRKWSPITDEDIYKCTQYFIKKVLGFKWEIWNVRVNKRISEDKQLELPLEYK